MTERKAPPRTGGNAGEDKQPGSRQEDARRARFARAIARSEFGRHYWDEGLQAQLRDARERRKKK